MAVFRDHGGPLFDANVITSAVAGKVGLGVVAQQFSAQGGDAAITVIKVVTRAAGVLLGDFGARTQGLH